MWSISVEPRPSRMSTPVCSSQRRPAVKNRGPIFAQESAHRLRCRPLTEENRCGANREWKTEGVAETIGKKQFRCGKNHVAFAYADDRLRVKLRGVDHAGLDMHDAFGRASGT